MGDRGEDGQRYFKVTPKGRAPKVHMEWPAEEKIPWYYYYTLHGILMIIAIPVVIARRNVPGDTWLACLLDMVLVVLVIMIIQPPNERL